MKKKKEETPQDIIEKYRPMLYDLSLDLVRVYSGSAKVTYSTPVADITIKIR